MMVKVKYLQHLVFNINLFPLAESASIHSHTTGSCDTLYYVIVFKGKW